MGLRGEIIMGFSPEIELAQYLSLYQKVMAKAGVFIVDTSALKCGGNGGAL